ncbi:hypothetical protein TL16_g04965 [Triparma laevis f. inornata]|uniref:Cilia- and flagella-associated protein 36 n=1 Tax=Triparma laevis f. inornata TaxID=1714386 RepID=A0A9W7AG59_9STRA|nr:hypothetical protein TL16_g04965 [Triparma laevis f. inornata]
MPRPPSPSSSDLFITGISEYLTSPVFLDSINSYVESHCCMFDVSTDYSPGQHAIFLEFRTTVEKMLESTLSTLGGTSEQFFEALKLDGFKDTPRVINVIDTLRSLDDFVGFHDNMVARNVELERLEEREIEGVEEVGGGGHAQGEFKSMIDDSVVVGVQRQQQQKPNSVPQASFKDFDFEMLQSMASNLLLNRSTSTLSPYDNLMIPWAEAVLHVKDEMESPMVDEERKADIMRELARHKLKVDFILASKFVNDRRAGVVSHLEGGGVGGEAVGYNNSGVSESNLENIYFRFKEFLQQDKDPTTNLDHILFITSEYVGINDVDILVVMLKWLEMEKLIAEVHKRINRLLNEEEEEELSSPVVEVKEEKVEEQQREKEQEEVNEVNEVNEGYDAESGYNFYYNTKTFETQWEPPVDEAYVPVTLDAMGYEMVEEEEGAEEGDGNADWEWDEEGGKWVFKGEGGVARTKSEEGGAPPSSSKERDSVKKKKKKKKKKFVVRAKAETPKEGEPPSSAIPFFLAQTTSHLMTPKQQRQMEDILLGSSAAQPKTKSDTVNPLHAGGGGGGGGSKLERRSVEKKRQRAEEKRRREEGGRKEGEVERTPVVELVNAPSESKDEGAGMVVEEIDEKAEGGVPPAPITSPGGTFMMSPMHITPPTGLPSLAQMQKKANPLPPIGGLMRRASGSEDNEVASVGKGKGKITTV